MGWRTGSCGWDALVERYSRLVWSVPRSFRLSYADAADVYSGITLRAMGFPLSMFTALVAVARTVGWVSQWKEMIEDPEQKIGRPRQLYIGATERPYVPVDRRG